MEFLVAGASNTSRLQLDTISPSMTTASYATPGRSRNYHIGYPIILSEINCADDFFVIALQGLHEPAVADDTVAQNYETVGHLEGKSKVLFDH